MGSTLRLDAALLEETGSSLERIAAEFDDADRRAAQVAEGVGDDELANAVRDFAVTWTGRREKLRGSVENLAELTSAVATQFDGLDKDLSSSLDGER